MPESRLPARSPGNRSSRHSTLSPVDCPLPAPATPKNPRQLPDPHHAGLSGVYLLAGAVGSHLMEWLGRAELVWREFGIIPAAAIAAAIILSLEVVRLQRKINSLITQIGETP